LPDPLTARSLGVAEHDGRPCERIEGMRRGERNLVWVERGTNLVLKLEASHTFDAAHYDRRAQELRKLLSSMPPDDPARPGLERMLQAFSHESRDTSHTERTIVWHPTLDRPVDPAVFDFHAADGKLRGGTHGIDVDWTAASAR
jgi:hypothetical protein